MSFEKEIEELKRISYQEFDEMEIESFMETIEELWDKADNSIIGDLCLVFDDEMEHPSALVSVMKMFFYISDRCGMEEGMFELAKGIPQMLIRGKDWAEYLHKMILNSDENIASYVKAIKKVEDTTKQMIINILKKVKESQPDRYGEKVDKILEELN